MQQLVKAKYRVRIKPNKKQFQQIMQFAGCSRFVYNHLLSVQKELSEAGLKLMNTKEMEAEIKSLKQKYDWLYDCDATSIQQARIDLQRAFNNFFKGVKGEFGQRYGYPKFQSRHENISFRTPHNNGKADVVGRKLKLPKIGLIPIKTRTIPNYKRLTSVTIIVSEIIATVDQKYIQL